MCASETPLAYRWTDDDAAPDASGGSVRSAKDESGRKRRLEYPPAPEPLAVPVMDNHTHLNFRDGLVEVSVKDALDAAAAVGVQAAVQVACDLESARFTVQALDEDSRLLGALAIHPNDAPLYAARGELEAALEEIETLAAHPRVRAIGETGLDYFRTAGEEEQAIQHYSFRRHIDIARRLGLTLQIHDRDAHDDVVRILLEEEQPSRVVFHCFSGDESLASICNEHGWFMSFAGPVGFKANDHLRQALSLARRDLILVETDSPFLTPHPHRGRPNASYMIPYTMRAMAEALEADLDELCADVARNTVAAYGSWD
ncbi:MULTISPECIES: TatD family hydrolase [Arthrobacter]|uniref:TatD family hydrolase n=2 Tax=Arthrobacter TaxID=1663 RepID=A0ABU9KKH9_9MICC|nr:TatD family hydrolase [Arthrobacter sp. YJM1]MDP5227347.1 TatD family hydrolase [Arthrobacter sp. YJM1]